MKWTDDMVQRALTMRRHGVPFRQIDEALGVNRNGTFSKFSYLIATPEQKERKRQLARAWRRRNHIEPARDEPKVEIPARSLLEREARLHAADRRTTTQLLCGDPPPGYSALDRREMAHGR